MLIILDMIILEMLNLIIERILYYQRKPKSKWIWVPKTNSHGPENRKGSNALSYNFVVGTQNKEQMDIGQRLFQTYDWKAGVIFHPPK